MEYQSLRTLTIVDCTSYTIPRSSYIVRGTSVIMNISHRASLAQPLTSLIVQYVTHSIPPSRIDNTPASTVHLTGLYDTVTNQDGSG